MFTCATSMVDKQVIRALKDFPNNTRCFLKIGNCQFTVEHSLSWKMVSGKKCRQVIQSQEKIIYCVEKSEMKKYPYCRAV